MVVRQKPSQYYMQSGFRGGFGEVSNTAYAVTILVLVAAMVYGMKSARRHGQFQGMFPHVPTSTPWWML